MTILKKGKLPIIYYTGTCTHCGCQIRCNINEICDNSVLCPTNHCHSYIKVYRTTISPVVENDDTDPY